MQATAVLLLCSAYVCASLSQQVHWASDLLVLVRGEALYPDNPYSMVGLAAEYSERGAHAEAIAFAQKAVRLHPEYSAAPLALAESYIRAGQFEEGRFWLQRVSPEFMHSETGLAAFAGLYGRMGDFDKAFAFCSEILAKEPELYSALYNCGNVHLMDGQYQEAEGLLRRAVQAAPEQAAPRHYLGRALLSQNRTSEASRIFSRQWLSTGRFGITTTG